MNLIKNINFKILFALVAGLFAMNACTDKNDWDTDSSYDRLFRPTNLTISGTTATTANVTFGSISGADYYTLELSMDSLVFENVVAVFDTTEYMFMLENLETDTQYSLRAMAIDADGSRPNSEWAEVAFKTRAEQIMEPVNAGDILSSTVVLRWTPGEFATNMVINDADENEVQNIPVTPEMIAAGEITIDGLTPETSYEALLMNNDKVRGSASFTTYPQVPEADVIIRLAAGDVLTQEMFDGIEGSSATITFEAGALFTYEETLNLPDGVSFTFFGLPGETQAILNIRQIEMAASHDFIRFVNLDISGLMYDASGEPTGGTNQYLFNQSGATTTNSLEFTNCAIHDFANTPLRMKDSGDKLIENLSMDNCVVYNVEDSYYVINVSASNHVINNISLTNSTFYNIGRLFLHNKSNNNSVLIADCTFNNVLGSGRYFFDFSSSFGPANGFTMRNTIVGSTQNEGARGIRLNGNMVITNSYYTTDFVLGGTTAMMGLMNPYSGASTDLFVDPANGDLSIADELFEGATSAGDPRWYFQ